MLLHSGWRIALAAGVLAIGTLAHANGGDVFQLRPTAPTVLSRQLDRATSGQAFDAANDSGDVVFWDAFELCGNGSIDAGETCDRNDLNGQTCTTLGYSGGSLGCTRQCAFDTSQCTQPTCTILTCNSNADCGGAACGPCFMGLCLGYLGN